ncbi:BTB/POZ-like protein, partial [Metarhizium brunneum ARSEF 3297]
MSIPDLRIDPSEALDLCAAMVDVVVGSELSKRFTVHEGLLISDLGKRNFKDLVIEEEDGHKCIFLQSHSPASFKVYVNWLYRRRIPIPVQAVKTSSAKTRRDGMETSCQFLGLTKTPKKDHYLDKISLAFMLVDVFVRYGSGQQLEKLKPAQDHLREFLVNLARDLVTKDLRSGSREYRSQKWFNGQEEPSPQFLFGVVLDLLPDYKVLR